MFILAFETSCDETSCAILKNRKILANISSSHITGKDFGGIMPEFSSRTHMELIIPSLKLALEISQVELKQISVISATQGPGLVGSLLVGFVFAKSLAKSMNKPFIPVDHLEAHLFSIFEKPDTEFPILFLLVSGGHTEFFLMENFNKIKYLGGTLDDAAGECLDKGARILGFRYPGAAKMAKLAEKGNPELIKFPIPETAPFSFSFSGLKTALLRYVSKLKDDELKEKKKHIAASFQETVFKHLLEKTEEAVKILNIRNLKIGVVGGVAVNKRLREIFKNRFEKVYFPHESLCGDNAGMVGLRAYYAYLNKEKGRRYSDDVYTRYPFQLKRKVI